MDTDMAPSSDGKEELRLAAGYIRTATTGGDAPDSLAAQKLAVERFAEENGIRIIDWYEDSGSGLDVGRPALRKLLADAQSGNSDFGHVLVHSPSRLSRKMTDLFQILSDLETADIKVVSVQ